MSLSGFYYGVNTAIIAKWNSDANWGTPVTLIAVELANISMDTNNGKLKGNDRIVDIHAKVINVSGKIKLAFADLESFAILTGETVVDSSPTSKSIIVGETDRPYFGLAVKVIQTNGSGDLQFFLPKIKITGNMPLSAAWGAYITPELSFEGVYDTAIYGALKIVEHATATSLTLPIT